MEPGDANDPGPMFVDTPSGIFTASGVWFHTTEEALRNYAAPVLDHVPLDRLIHWAEVWIRSPQIIALWGLPLLLVWMPPGLAALVALLLYLGWTVLSPAVASSTAAWIFDKLDVVVAQGAYYVLVLSYIAALDRYGAVGVGLAGFILLRWGLLKRAVHPLVRRGLRALYALPVSDQVLRAFIIRVALNYELSLPQLDAIEQRMIENWRSKNDVS